MTHRHCIHAAIFASLFLTFAPLHSAELYDEHRVAKIEVVVESPDEDAAFDSKPVLSKLKTKEGDQFSQLTFDSDLKSLSESYERVEPTVELRGDDVYIVIRVIPKPYIHGISFQGNATFSDSTLRGELDVKPGVVFNRQEFNKSFNKIKDYYYKKGYFEAQIDYVLVPIAGTQEVDVEVRIDEGRPGIIQEIVLTGFESDEKSDILDQIHMKKYRFLTSWLTGDGIYREEAKEQDRMTVLNYMQNKGYADAKVDIELHDDPQAKRIIVEISVERGPLYHIGEVHLSGNALISTDELMKKSGLTAGAIYAPDTIRDASQAMKDVYGQKGYIDASVQYETHLKADQPVFDLDFTIDEGQQYKIGLIHIFGNVSTKNNVILRESLLVPGETFDSRKLKATQQRLEAIGYFKTVNVYAVRTPDDAELGDNYRDVYIEVEETPTGNISLFAGFSSTDDVFGGLELTERNFHLAKVGKILVGKPSEMRGGGEYFHVRGTAGAKQNNILVSWLNPYVNDSLWRFGVELSQTYSKLQHGAKVITYGGSVYTSYPLSMYWTAGIRERLRHSNDSLDLHPIDQSPVAIASCEATKALLDQKGLISAVSGNISYDSIDNAYKPHRGWRSYLESEVAGVGGNYVFAKFSYLNSIYFPVWSKGTLKLRGDFKYLVPFGKTDSQGVPYSERFFLGGEMTVRGYKPFMLGPLVQLKNSAGQLENTSTPLGGLSSALVSLEYNQQIFKILDAFVFFDVGSVNFSALTFKKVRATAGGGLRFDLGNRTPIMIGWGHAFDRQDRKDDKTQTFFFSMGGQF